MNERKRELKGRYVEVDNNNKTTR